MTLPYHRWWPLWWASYADNEWPHRSQFSYPSSSFQFSSGGAVAQSVSRWILTASTRVRVRVKTSHLYKCCPPSIQWWTYWELKGRPISLPYLCWMGCKIIPVFEMEDGFLSISLSLLSSLSLHSHNWAANGRKINLINHQSQFSYPSSAIQFGPFTDKRVRWRWGGG